MHECQREITTHHRIAWMPEGNNDSPSHCAQSWHSGHEHFSTQSKLAVVQYSTHPAAVVTAVDGVGLDPNKHVCHEVTNNRGAGVKTELWLEMPVCGGSWYRGGWCGDSWRGCELWGNHCCVEKYTLMFSISIMGWGTVLLCLLRWAGNRNEFPVFISRAWYPNTGKQINVIDQ